MARGNDAEHKEDNEAGRGDCSSSARHVSRIAGQRRNAGIQYSALGGMLASPEPPEHVYGAQANTISVALTGPTGGRAEALLLDQNGNTVSRAESEEIVSGEYSTLSNGERYAGYPLTLDLPDTPERYTLVSREVEWTLNGEVIDLRSYGLSISKGQYPASPHVKLRSVDDSGDYSAYVTN